MAKKFTFDICKIGEEEYISKTSLLKYYKTCMKSINDPIIKYIFKTLIDIFEGKI